MRFDPAQYETVDARISKFWDHFANGALFTEVISDPNQLDEVVVRAFAYTDRNDTRPAATGIASEKRGRSASDGANFGSHLENAECVPLSSEILTRHGFLPFSMAEVGEEVLSYNIHSDQCEWTPLLKVSVFPNAQLVRLRNEHGWEFDCTPDHKWAVTRELWKSREIALLPTNEIKTSTRVIMSAKAPSGDHPLTPTEAAILAWLVTDGTIRRKGNHVRGQIGQTKPAQVERIRELVGSVSTEHLGKARTRTFPGGKTYNTLPGYKWDIPAPILRPLLEKAQYYDKPDLIPLVLKLSTEARASMLEVMMDAEGDARGNFYQNDGPVLEAFQLLATLEGKAISCTRDTSIGNCKAIKLRTYRHVCGSQLTLIPVDNAPVWCPTTALGTWIMRQPNGGISITGNTSAIGRALANLNFKVKKDGARPSRTEMEKANRYHAGDYDTHPDAPQATGTREPQNTANVPPAGNTLAGKVNDSGEICSSCHCPPNKNHLKTCKAVIGIPSTDDGEWKPEPANEEEVKYAETPPDPSGMKEWGAAFLAKALRFTDQPLKVKDIRSALFPEYTSEWDAAGMKIVYNYSDEKWQSAIDTLVISTHGNESAESIKTRPITRQQKTFAAWQGAAPDPDAVGKLEELIRADTTGNSMQECFNNLTLAQCDLVDSYIASIGHSVLDSQFDKAVANA